MEKKFADAPFFNADGACAEVADADVPDPDDWGDAGGGDDRDVADDEGGGGADAPDDAVVVPQAPPRAQVTYSKVLNQFRAILSRCVWRAPRRLTPATGPAQTNGV